MRFVALAFNEFDQLRRQAEFAVSSRWSRRVIRNGTGMTTDAVLQVARTCLEDEAKD